MTGPADEDADDVIVGGGSAGCVLARRLSDDPAARVVLIEARPAPTGIYASMPAGAIKLRVIDASIMPIMPIMPSANTNAPVIMVAEKGADLVRASAIG